MSEATGNRQQAGRRQQTEGRSRPFPHSTIRNQQSPTPDPRRLSPALVAGRTLVLKLGGSVGQHDTLPEELARLQPLGARIVLVHGGGPLITSWLQRLGKETHFVRGLRYTDQETIEIVRMVLAGLVNGEVVARLGQEGVRAVGLSGSDGGLLRARRYDPEIGLVGEITAVDPGPICTLLDAGYVVALAPLALDDTGSFLNVNADTVAGEIAAALKADCLIFFTDVAGISDGTASEPRRQLQSADARRLIDGGVITGGMIPKVEACLRALSTVAAAQIVDGRRPHALLEALADPSSVGTVIRSS